MFESITDGDFAVVSIVIDDLQEEEVPTVTCFNTTTKTKLSCLRTVVLFDRRH